MDHDRDKKSNITHPHLKISDASLRPCMTATSSPEPIKIGEKKFYEKSLSEKNAHNHSNSMEAHLSDLPAAQTQSCYFFT